MLRCLKNKMKYICYYFLYNKLIGRNLILDYLKGNLSDSFDLTILNISFGAILINSSSELSVMYYNKVYIASILLFGVKSDWSIIKIISSIYLGAEIVFFFSSIAY